MGVSSATEGSLNIGGIGNNSTVGGNTDLSNDFTNKSATVSTISHQANDSAAGKPQNQGLEATYASRTGISVAVAKAKVGNLSFANAATKTVDDKQFDGHLVGNDGTTYAPGTPLAEINAVTPASGITNDRTIIQVNGISTDVSGQLTSLQAIADQTGSRVIGLHNATAGGLRDVVQSLGDKVDLGNNPAVDSLADTIYNELKAGRQVDLMAHSQGAIITSRALADVSNRLQLEDGMSQQNAEALLGNVRAETFGGAARRYPDGPQYVHYVNKKDFVPMAFGLRNFFNPFAQAGRDAVTHYFKESDSPHSFNQTYLNERVRFEDARAGNFN